MVDNFLIIKDKSFKKKYINHAIPTWLASDVVPKRSIILYIFYVEKVELISDN